MEKLPKLAVSTASTPTSKNAACMPRMTSGRVRQSISLQPSSVGAAEVVGGEVETLDVRAEGTVEDDDPFGDGIEVGLPGHGLSRLPATPRRPGCIRSAVGGGRLGPMAIKTDSLAAGRGPLTRVSRDLSWFDPAPAWRRVVDVVVARAVPSAAGALGVPVGEKGAVPRQLGVDRATLASLGFDGKAGQTLVVPRRDGADVVAIGTGGGSRPIAELRDAAAVVRPGRAQARRRWRRACTRSVATPPRPPRPWSKASCWPATASTR